ncbi:MAG: dihydroorotase, partial [Bacteroidota bacterium]
MAQITQLLIRQARIIDASSPYNGTVKDILIENGVIRSIEDHIEAVDATEFSAPNLHLSQGWIDLSANLCDPGFEHKEDLESGLESAAYGGFTTVVAGAQTFPVTDTKGAVEYKMNRSRDNVVSISPLGALTEKSEGKHLAELYDMHQHGAVAFFDGKTQT